MITDSGKTLGQLFEALVAGNAILPSRKGPIKSALKQYSQLLGCSDPFNCHFENYFQSDHVRSRLIDEGAGRTTANKVNGSIHLGRDAIRNLKNNVGFVLRKAVELGLVSSKQELFSEKNHRRLVRERPRRNEHVLSPKYTLDPVPKKLKEELEEYRAWSTKIVNRARPGKLLKRAVTFEIHRGILLRMAGYLVKFEGFDRDSITLSTLIGGSSLVDYLTWYSEQQGKVTHGFMIILSKVQVLARYLLITGESDKKAEVQQAIAELNQFRSSLGPVMTTVDKSKRWLSLSELEKVRLSTYPHNARNNARRVGRGLATDVLTSLLIGLEIRIPFRQRNLREMLWNPQNPENGQNLYLRHGSWHLRFSGLELKIPFVKGAVHSVEHEFPSDLVSLLEEWLRRWRPIQLLGQKTRHRGSECSRNGQELVFLNMAGGPLVANGVNETFNRATYKFTGIAVNVHMIRTIWATEYIKDTKNVVDAAFMLGDTVETVLKSYAKLLDQDCGKRASEWVTKRLGNQ